MNLLQRLQQDYPWIDFRMSGALNPDECVMVIQNTDVVDLADGQAPTTMSGEIDLGLATEYRHLGMRIPRIKQRTTRSTGSPSEPASTGDHS